MPPITPNATQAALLVRLKPLREKLIDVSLRSRLLNYRDVGSQTLPLLPCDLNLLYERLVTDENVLEVEGTKIDGKKAVNDVPEESKGAEKNRPIVDFSGEDATRDLKAGTLRSRDSMLKTESRMTALFRKYRECLDAFGSNLCYVALGFVEWTAPNDDDGEKRYAPLILVPVSLSRIKREVPVEAPSGDLEATGNTQLRRNGVSPAKKPSLAARMMAYKFTVKYDGEDIADNVALRLKLEGLPRGISLPTFDSETESSNIEGYFLSIEEALSHLSPDTNTGWKVIRAARLAFFSSAKEAMYRDLDPAQWPTSGLVGREWIQAALDGRDQDTTPSVTDDEVTQALHIDPIPTVLETDGSQMRAIVRVLRGDPMVIQGPPGTGKSQTITNLIAATLAKGKSVLFVAEKMAALSVVRQRMEESGLGRYCLELHSAKATPRQVLDQVRQRLAHRSPPASSAAQSAADRQRLNQHRLALGDYGHSIHRKDNGLEETFHDLIWKRSQLIDALEELVVDKDTAIEFLPPLAMKENSGYVELGDLIEALKLAGRCVSEGVHLAAQPWHGTCPRELPTPYIEDAVKRILGTAQIAALKWHAAESELPLHEQWNSPTADQWLDLAQKFQPGTAPELSEFISATLASDFAAITRYDEYLDSLAQWRMPQSNEARALSENRGIDDAAIEKALSSAKQIEGTLLSRLPHETLDDVSHCGERISWLRDTLLNRIATLSALAHMIHVPMNDDTYSAGCALAAFAVYLAQTPPSVSNCLDRALLHPSTLAQVSRSRQHHQILEAEREALSAELRLDELMSASEWSELSLQLRQTSGGWFNWLPGTKGYKLRQQLKAYFLKRPKDDLIAIQTIDRAQKWRSEVASFAGAPDAQSLLGPAFVGMATDWASLEAAVTLLNLWSRQFGILSAQDFVLSHKDEVFQQAAVITSLAAQIGTYTNEWMALAETLFCQDEATLRQLSTQMLSDDVCAQAQIATALVNDLAGVNFPGTTETRAVPDLCNKAMELRRHASNILKLTENHEFLGSWHEGLLATDDKRISDAIVWYKQILGAQRLPSTIKVWLLSAATNQRTTEVIRCVQNITRAIQAWRDAMMPLSDILAFHDYAAPMSANHLERSAVMVLRDVEAALKAIPVLMNWYHLQESERQIDKVGGKTLWEWCRKSRLGVDAIEKAAHLAFVNQIVERLIVRHPELKTYHRQKLEEHRDGFRSLDKQVLRSFQREVNRSIFRKQDEAPSGQRRGSTKDYTEMSMLNHEMSKQKGHVPVRRLLKQGGAALKFLMPCWMMGPLAVAQFLEPEKVEFDLLIIDEASQVRPEDALGSLARAKQIVIVGDSKQMPPTDVFQALGVQAGDEEVEDEDGEMVAIGSPALSLTSILDTFDKQLPAETLRWHYRSQHQSLIAFSNETFYESTLIVPPSRWHGSDDLGIVRHYIEHGRLQARTNPAEASEVVRIMKEHVQREAPRNEDERETLGVVAMNAVQQDLISEKWEKACQEDMDLEMLFKDPVLLALYTISESKNGASKAGLFIRNLENVQGDERDVIIISTTYGKNPSGEMHQRFGPVNKAGGWRRLNVLFTRARKRIHLVTSMMHNDVQPDRNQAESGRNFLNKYLQYAETGHLPDSGTAGYKATPDSGFEESVARCLIGLGYEFHYQVGVQGFFIDIGVIHPEHPGQYLFGIECDGAAYHSHPISRDRDRIRQEILENRGWKIFRIWSTDWYRNRKMEVERLHSFLRQRHVSDFVCT